MDRICKMIGIENKKKLVIVRRMRGLRTWGTGEFNQSLEDISPKETDKFLGSGRNEFLYHNI